MQDGQHLKIIKILIKAYLFCIYCYLFISLLATITSDPHAYFCSASLELLFCFVLIYDVITYFIHSYSPCQYYSFLLTFVGAILLALLDSLLLNDIMIPFTLPSYSDLHCLFIVSHYVGSIGTSPGFNRVIIIVFYYSRFHWIVIINYKLQPCKGMDNLQGEGK